MGLLFVLFFVAALALIVAVWTICDAAAGWVEWRLTQRKRARGIELDLSRPRVGIDYPANVEERRRSHGSAPR